MLKYAKNEVLDEFPTFAKLANEEYLAKDTDFKNTNDADSKEHERIRLALQDLSKQFFVKFATWGLDDWEKLCGIDVDYNNSLGYERRRARIIAQLMGTGAMTPERRRLSTCLSAHRVRHSRHIMTDILSASIFHGIARRI